MHRLEFSLKDLFVSFGDVQVPMTQGTFRKMLAQVPRNPKLRKGEQQDLTPSLCFLFSPARRIASEKC